MILIIGLALLFISLLYFLLILTLVYFWSNHSIDCHKDISMYYRVSVVIAARNEKKHLPLLIADLKRQTYPLQYFEIIIIDDHSDEQIDLILQKEKHSLSNLKIIELDDYENGKKMALARGTKDSSGEILLFTDADCRIPPEWISMHVAKYQDVTTGMVIGLVDYINQPGILQDFFRADLLSLMIPGAGAVAMKRPVYCNGANLSVRKEIYLDLIHELHTEIMSGDDVFLLHAYKKKNLKKIVLLKNKDALVYTIPPQNIHDFIQQRSRWLSKSRYYSDHDTLFLGTVVALANASFCVSLLLVFLQSFLTIATLSCLIKILTDLIVFYTGKQIFKGNKRILFIPLFDLIYPVYLLFILWKGNLSSILWKGRLVRNKILF